MKYLDARLKQLPDAPAKLVYNEPHARIYHGKAHMWTGPENVDLVFTNPYGPLPASLHKTPMIVHQWVHRQEELRAWIGGAELTLIDVWNDGREAFWCANMDPEWIDDSRHLLFTENGGLTEFKPEAGGWYPERMVFLLLEQFCTNKPSFTVWDGFAGRATVGRVAIRDFGMKYVGVEELYNHVELCINNLRGIVPNGP